MTAAAQLSYRARIPYCRVQLAKELLSLMEEKKSNLCISADVTSSAELVALADTLGPYMCLLKTHVDILVDFEPSVVVRLQELATKHRFLIFEDRKFADIGVCHVVRVLGN